MFKSKKIQLLLEENEELKTKFQVIHSQEDNIKNLNEVLKKLRLEVARLNDERRGLKDSIDKIRIDEEDKQLEIDELSERIGHLREMKDDLQNVVLSYSNQIESIESTLKINHDNLSDQNTYGTDFSENENDNSELVNKKEELEQYISNSQNILKNLSEEETQLVDRKEFIGREVEQLEEKLLKLQKTHSDIEEKVNAGNERILLLKSEEESLRAVLEKKQVEISDVEINLQNKQADISNVELMLQKKQVEISNVELTLQNKQTEISSVEIDLKNKQTEISSVVLYIQKKQAEISAFEMSLQNIQAEIPTVEMNLLRLKEDEKVLLGKIGELKQNEILLSGRIGKLQLEENSKINVVREIDSELSEKAELKNSLDQEHIILMNELNDKRKLLFQTEKEYNKFFEESKIRKKELFDTDQTLSIKAQKLSNINIELMEYDKKTLFLKNEISKLESAKNDLLRTIQKDKEAAEKFADQNRKLTELVPLLEKRKLEIEQGNAELEGRFTVMFQRLNHELNQINRKRSILEQIVLKKEKDVDEKDQLLFEKIAALEESERVLNMRQVELESLEKQIAGLNEHKEIFKTDLIKMEQEALERKNYHADIRLETELLLKKKITIEKNLQEILLFMNESFERTKGRNSKYESELSYYEDQIQGYRTKIADSLNELNDIKEAVGSLKIEHEEYKSNIARLSALKKKLHEELTKHQTILQRYQKIREKLQIEQTTGKSFEDMPPKGKIGQPKEVKNPLNYKL
jgi:chromosome segregation ATPase